MVTRNSQSTASARKQTRASKSTPKHGDAEDDSASHARVARPSSLEIDLPDLEEAVDIEIVTENLNAVQAIYFAYQLEEMRLFQVIERIVDLFGQGLLPFGPGPGRNYLSHYESRAAERLTREERRDLYMRVFGAPGGDASSTANRDFDDLWLRFVSAVSRFARQLAIDPLLRDGTKMAISQEQVSKAGRDLAANLSRNGKGVAPFATKLLQTILEFSEIMQDAKLRNALGARDLWQVIDRVNTQYLGGARNVHRHRMQGRTGAVILRWIAKNVHRLTDLGEPLIWMGQSVEAQLLPAGVANNPIVNSTDWDLVDACEQWLAITGLQDKGVEQYSQPIEAPLATASSIDLPQLVRDWLRDLN